jgi:hypothetical protein
VSAVAVLFMIELLTYACSCETAAIRYGRM